MTTPREQFSALVRFQIDLWNDVEQRLRGVEGAVSLGRHGILELAGEAEGARVQDISVRLRITVGAVSRLVDRMEADGLLERRPHPDDRRSSRILLTESGREALAVTGPAIDAALEDVLGAEGGRRLAAVAAVAEAIGAGDTDSTDSTDDTDATDATDDTDDRAVR